MWDVIYPYLAAILPTIGLLVIAYVVFKTIFEADRKERIAQAQWQAEVDARERAGRSVDKGAEQAGDSDPEGSVTTE